MTREEFEQYAKENGLIVWSKEMSEKAIKALEQLPKLQNRCYALTKGVMCGFCNYECRYMPETEADNG